MRAPFRVPFAPRHGHCPVGAAGVQTTAQACAAAPEGKMAGCSCQITGFVDPFADVFLLQDGRATQHERKLVSMLIHEPVLYSGSLAKYRAAFLEDRAPLPDVASWSAAAESRFSLRSVRHFAFRPLSTSLPDPLVQTMGRPPDQAATSGTGCPPLDELANRFFLELWRVTL